VVQWDGGRVMQTEGMTHSGPPLPMMCGAQHCHRLQPDTTTSPQCVVQRRILHVERAREVLVHDLTATQVYIKITAARQWRCATAQR
jgi:hypothetical protein